MNLREGIHKLMGDYFQSFGKFPNAILMNVEKLENTDNLIKDVRVIKGANYIFNMEVFNLEYNGLAVINIDLNNERQREKFRKMRPPLIEIDNEGNILSMANPKATNSNIIKY